jgi:DNA-damage-inducible protein J
MPAIGVVRARIDPALKKEATQVLAQIGLSVSDAIRLMLVRVAAEGAMPFDVKVPNAETRAAMREHGTTILRRYKSPEALFASLDEDAG